MFRFSCKRKGIHSSKLIQMCSVVLDLIQNLHTLETLSAETPEERETQLDSMSARRNERLAAETSEERETWLNRMSACQSERLAAKTPKERETQLQFLL